MMLNDHQKALILAALLNSGLFLSGCFVAGLLTNNPTAWKLAIAATGFAFISYVCQYMSGIGAIYEYVAKTAVSASIIAGAASGIALLIKS